MKVITIKNKQTHQSLDIENLFENQHIKERVQKALIFLKNKNVPLAKYGKMEVTKQPKIPICEVHFYGITIRINSLPLL